MFPESLESKTEFEWFAREIGRAGVTVPLIANMTEFGRTPYLDIAEFERLGYRGVLFPVSLLRVAMRAMGRFLADLKEAGSQRSSLSQMMTRAELYELLRYEPDAIAERRSHEQDNQRTAFDSDRT